MGWGDFNSRQKLNKLCITWKSYSLKIVYTYIYGEKLKINWDCTHQPCHSWAGIRQVTPDAKLTGITLSPKDKLLWNQGQHNDSFMNECCFSTRWETLFAVRNFDVWNYVNKNETSHSCLELLSYFDSEKLQQLTTQVQRFR